MAEVRKAQGLRYTGSVNSRTLLEAPVLKKDLVGKNANVHTSHNIHLHKLRFYPPQQHCDAAHLNIKPFGASVMQHIACQVCFAKWSISSL